MADLSTRISDFLTSIEDYKPQDRPSGMTADVFNALLGMAKEQLTDDPVVGAVGPIGTDAVGRATVDVGSMRATMNQILSAMDETGPGFSFS